MVECSDIQLHELSFRGAMRTIRPARMLAVVLTAASLIFGLHLLLFLASKSRILSDIFHLRSRPDVLDLIIEARLSKLLEEEVRDERKCTTNRELRYLDFLHPVLRPKLCVGVEAYKLLRDGYPVCVLRRLSQPDILNVVRQHAKVETVMGPDNMQLLVYASSSDGNHASNSTVSDSTKLADRADWLMKFALRLEAVTFLNIGSNIGVYSLLAAKLGLQVVSVDPNIRNLLRLQLSLKAASLDAVLVWNFVSNDNDPQLRYLELFSDCDVARARLDTIPVMPLRVDNLSGLFRTSHIVMMLQGEELDFLPTAGRLFEEITVTAVQMEWRPVVLRGKAAAAAAVVEFFANRRYRAWSSQSLKPLDPMNFSDWHEGDVIWLNGMYDIRL